MVGQKRKIGIQKIKKALTGVVDTQYESSWFKIASEADDDYLVRRTIESLNNHLVDWNEPDLYRAIILLGLLQARDEQPSNHTLTKDEFNAA